MTWQNFFKLEMIEREEDNLLEKFGLPAKLMFWDFKVAKENFHVNIEEGRLGAIFKGIIRDGTVAADY